MFSVAAEFDPRVNEKPLDELPARTAHAVSRRDGGAPTASFRLR